MNENSRIFLEKLGLGWMIYNIAISVAKSPLIVILSVVAYFIYMLGITNRGGDK